MSDLVSDPHRLALFGEEDGLVSGLLPLPSVGAVIVHEDAILTDVVDLAALGDDDDVGFVHLGDVLGEPLDFALGAISVGGLGQDVAGVTGGDEGAGEQKPVYQRNLGEVVADGEPMDITTIEAFPDGRFYIFTEESIDGKEIIVTLKNPTDPAFHIIYTNGPGGDVPFFQEAAEENEAIAYVEDAYSYAYVKPTVLSSDPEDGSFNLPNDIKEFKLFLDKEANCAKIKATMGKENLTVSPAEGFAKEITLKRTGAGDLTTGTYTVKVTNIFCQLPLDDSDFSTYEFSFNAGKVSADPNDVPKELLPVEDYAATNAGGIPAGFYVLFGEEERTAESGGFGSGPRMFDFGAGGDFTKGLYFREGYVQFGSMEGYPLTLEEGKKYNIRFNTAQWKDNGTVCRFEILNEYEERVFVQMINNTPNMNGGTGAVNGSALTEISFTPESTGNYLIRWSAATSEDGGTGFFEILLGNPSVMYIPNIAGVEVTQMLNNALVDCAEQKEQIAKLQAELAQLKEGNKDDSEEESE